MNPGVAALQRLEAMGYRFHLDGDNIVLKYHGPDKPDPNHVTPLLDLVRQHKEKVREFLRCFCPKCGGVVFCPDLEGVSRCLACDWDLLARQYPGLRQRQ